MLALSLYSVMFVTVGNGGETGGPCSLCESIAFSIHVSCVARGLILTGVCRITLV